MHLTVREEERIQIWSAAEMARRRLKRGVRLNHPESVALITDEILERARDGSIPMVADLMEYGSRILNTSHVMVGVAKMIPLLQVEATMPDGTKLVTLMHPVQGDMSAESNSQPAADWELPSIPDSEVPDEAFDVGEPEHVGHIDFAEGDIAINETRARREVVIVNTGDRPVQVGAHYHLAEVNKALAFDREKAFGYRLDIASGSSIRFEPGQSRKVEIVELGGDKIAQGMNDITNGSTTDPTVKEEALQRLREEGYCFENDRYLNS